MVEWVVLVVLVYVVLGSNPLTGQIFFFRRTLGGVRRRAEIVRRSSAAESEVDSGGVENQACATPQGPKFLDNFTPQILSYDIY